MKVAPSFIPERVFISGSETEAVPLFEYASHLALHETVEEIVGDGSSVNTQSPNQEDIKDIYTKLYGLHLVTRADIDQYIRGSDKYRRGYNFVWHAMVRHSDSRPSMSGRESINSYIAANRHRHRISRHGHVLEALPSLVDYTERRHREGEFIVQLGPSGSTETFMVLETVLELPVEAIVPNIGAKKAQFLRDFAETVLSDIAVV